MNWEDIVKEMPAKNRASRKADAREFATRVMTFITDELSKRYTKLNKQKPLFSGDTYPYSSVWFKFENTPAARSMFIELYNLYFEVEYNLEEGE